MPFAPAPAPRPLEATNALCAGAPALAADQGPARCAPLPRARRPYSGALEPRARRWQTAEQQESEEREPRRCRPQLGSRASRGGRCAHPPGDAGHARGMCRRPGVPVVPRRGPSSWPGQGVLGAGAAGWAPESRPCSGGSGATRCEMGTPCVPGPSRRGPSRWPAARGAGRWRAFC